MTGAETSPDAAPLTVLLAVDPEEENDHLVRELQRLRGGDPWETHVLAVAPPDPDFVGFEEGTPTDRDQQAEGLTRQRHRLDALVRKMREEDGFTVTSHYIRGQTAEAILQEAEKVEADLIVVGSHQRRGLARALLGSVSSTVLRSAQRPVLVIPPDSDESTT